MKTPEEFLESNGFLFRSLDRTALLTAFGREMEEGLAGRPSSLKMIPTYVSPEGELRRDTPVTVLDAGGTNLRAATVEFPSGADTALIAHKEKEQMPGATAYVAPDDFYGTFAAHVRRTAPFAKDPSIGFCFSYACETSPEGDGRLLYWTKQIQAPEVIGQWVGAELAKRLDPKPPRILVLNDTVTTLLAGKAAERPFVYAKRIPVRLAPEFAEGAEVKAAFVPPKAEKDKPAPKAPTHVSVTFPAAETRAKCRVFEYEVQAVIVEDDVEMVATTRRVIAPDFHLPASKSGKSGKCVFALSELPKGVHLRFDVSPIECFGKKGRAIRSTSLLAV